jgi:hypothetical protein
MSMDKWKFIVSLQFLFILCTNIELMLRNTTDVFRKTMNFDVWQMVDPIKVGVGLSGTIASHNTLTLVVGMTMIPDDFLYA